MHAAVLELRRRERAELHARVGRAHVLAHVEVEDEVAEGLLRHQEAVGHTGPRRTHDGAVDHLVVGAAAERLPSVQSLAVEQRRAGRFVGSARHRGHQKRTQRDRSPHSNPPFALSYFVGDVASTWMARFTFMSKPKFLPQLMPKSSRLMVPCASAPQSSWPCFIGCALHLNDLMVSTTGLVTPCSVSSPCTSVGAPFANLASLPLYCAVGNFSTSRNSPVFRCLSRSGTPVSTVVVSMVTSTVPVFASRSSTMVPPDAVNMPRHTETPPKWSASKDGWVCLASTS